MYFDATPAHPYIVVTLNPKLNHAFYKNCVLQDLVIARYSDDSQKKTQLIIIALCLPGYVLLGIQVSLQFYAVYLGIFKIFILLFAFEYFIL